MSQQTLKLVDQDFKSFFGSLKSKRNGTNDRKIKIPSYKEKDGSHVTIYTNQALSSKRIGHIKLSGTDIYIKTDKKNIQQVRIIPKLNAFVVEIIYLHPDVALKENDNKYASVDLGLNNLAAIGSNCAGPILINGKPLKAMNQFYNKKLAQMKSILEIRNKSKYSRKTRALTTKRNNKIKDYLHKATTKLVNHLDSNQIGHLFIGENKEWKQEINIGKKNNQNFVQVPFDKFKQMIEYKAAMRGIKVIYQEESYTSKASFLDNDMIPIYGNVHEKPQFSGRRIKRGLYQSKCGKLINADINGALNILKKAIGDFNYDPIEVCSTPVVIKITN